MAIGVASIVSPKTAGVGLNVDGPLFGSVQSGAGPFVVLWFNGQNNSVVATSLDEILAGSGTIAAAIVGRQVKVTSPTGQTNYGLCVCVANYLRNGTDTALLRNPAGYFIEVPSSQVAAV
jgi:hypothetical protein